MLMRILQLACKDLKSLVIQIWQAEHAAPIQLFYGDDDVKPFTYNVFLAILPRSNKAIWLPLIKEDVSSSHVNDSMVWWDRFRALDANIAAEQASAAAKKAPQRSALRRRPGPSTSPRIPVTRSQAAQHPAESSGSIYHGTKRGPSPGPHSEQHKNPRTK